MKKTLIAAAALGLVIALGGNAEARPYHHPFHRGAIAHMGHFRGPRRGGRFHPSPVQRFLAPMFRYGYHH